MISIKRVKNGGGLLVSGSSKSFACLFLRKNFRTKNNKAAKKKPIKGEKNKALTTFKTCSVSIPLTPVAPELII